MPIVTIPVHQGRVTSRDPSLLSPGELITSEDCTYKPGDPGLWAAGTRAAFNAAAEAGSIRGVRFCEFHNANAMFLALATGQTSYRKATATNLTGAFSNVTTNTLAGPVSGDISAAAVTLDTIHYGNEHVAVNGADRNRVFKSDGTADFHGMLANTTAPTVAVTGASFVLATGNTLTYWVEEQVRVGSTVTKRSAASAATAVTFTGTGVSVALRITRPAIVNPDATHWALYRTATNGAFPVGAALVSTLITDAALDDTGTTANPTLPTGDVYELATVTLAGTSTNVPRNAPPPIATTGDVFEDSLVLNDISDPAAVRYSWPDEIHKFPAVNTIRFETKEADEVVLIRALGNFFMVGLNGAMWRVNTFPRPTDAQFDLGRVKEFVCGFGAVAAMAADTFDFGQGLRLAWVSRSGIIVTDGVSWDNLTDDVDWPATVEPTRLAYSRLVNNKAEYRLEMDYTPLGGTANTETMYLHYHHSHAKQGGGGGIRAKATWPVHRRATTSCRAVVGGEDRVFTGHVDGKLYVEDEGLTDASGAGGRAMAAVTSEFAAPGRKTDLRVSRFWAHHSAAPSRAARVSLTIGTEDRADETVYADLGLGLREATQTGKQGLGQNFTFGFTNADNLGPLRLNYFLAEVDAAGATRK